MNEATATAEVTTSEKKANKELLLRYAWLKQEVTKAESEMEMLKDQVLEDVLKLRGDTDSPIALEELPGYTFSVMKRKKWEYSDFVKESEKSLKARKAEEEKLGPENGGASFTETEHLIFKGPKE